MEKYRVLTKKEIKALKKEIVEDTAINVGYWNEIFSKIALIDHWLMFEVMNNAYELGFKYDERKSNFENFLVTEFVKEIGYQDFKRLIPYFLGFPGSYLERGKVYVKNY